MRVAAIIGRRVRGWDHKRSHPPRTGSCPGVMMAKMGRANSPFSPPASWDCLRCEGRSFSIHEGLGYR